MIKSSRNQNTGAHLTPPVKEALKKEAEKINVTLSRLIYEILCERYNIPPIQEMKTSYFRTDKGTSANPDGRRK